MHAWRLTTASSRRSVRSRRVLSHASRPSAPRVMRCVSQSTCGYRNGKRLGSACLGGVPLLWPKVRYARRRALLDVFEAHVSPLLGPPRSTHFQRIAGRTSVRVMCRDAASRKIARTPAQTVSPHGIKHRAAGIRSHSDPVGFGRCSRSRNGGRDQGVARRNYNPLRYHSDRSRQLVRTRWHFKSPKAVLIARVPG